MVSRGSRATLWHRLSTHRGTTDGRGNHRGSILRLHIGTALISRDGQTSDAETWGKGQNASRDVRDQENLLEEKVSSFIAAMRVCWLAIEDDAAPWSDRAYIERNTIGLLAGHAGPLEPASSKWLGNHASNEVIRKSGIWNVTHVDYDYDCRFLDVMETFVAATCGSAPVPTDSIAPAGWYLKDKSNGPRGQRFLFEDNN